MTRPGPEHANEGFADRTGAAPGDQVRLFVSTTAAHHTVTACRVDAYGDHDRAPVQLRDRHRVRRRYRRPSPNDTTVCRRTNTSKQRLHGLGASPRPRDHHPWSRTWAALTT